MNRVVALLCLCGLLRVFSGPSLPLRAQTSSSTPIDFGVWPGYKGNHGLGVDSNWRLVIEGVAKRNGIAGTQANLVEGGLGYEWKPDLQFSAGYGFEEHYPFDSSSQPYKWPEQRLFQEMKFPSVLTGKNATMKQTLILEERWLARKSAPDFDTITSYKFELRLRYQLKYSHALNSKIDFVTYDEPIFRLLPTNEKHFEENRLFGGVAFKLENKMFDKIETGYMLQTVRNSAETEEGRKRVNNVIRITLSSNAPLKLK
jgi:hypothetical protein